MATKRIWPLNLQSAERQAAIIPHGATAKALAEYQRRRAAGESVELYEGVERGQRLVFVGAPLTTGGVEK